MAVKIIKKKSVFNTRILGLDPSTKTGYAILDCDPNGIVTKHEVGRIHFPKIKGMARLHAFYERVVKLIHDNEPDGIIIEGYGFANKHTLVTLVEVGTMLRYAIHTSQVPWLEVPPTSLKKFTTGVGNAKKDKMLLEVYKRWDFDANTDDEADAFALAMFGFGVCGLIDMPQGNMGAVKKLIETNPRQCNQLQKLI